MKRNILRSVAPHTKFEGKELEDLYFLFKVVTNSKVAGETY